MRRTLALTVCVAGLLAGCGSSDLAKTDPKGAEACTALAQAFRDKDDTDKAIDGSLRAGSAARQAKTPAIRDAVIDLAGTPAADPDRMRAACVEAGVDVPPVPS